MKPQLSRHFETREPSSIRLTQIEFMKRKDSVSAINLAIGNVSLPMHPAMQKRMFTLDEGPFCEGIVKYSATIGEKETNEAFLHLIACSGFSVEGLSSMITDGGSQAMELVILGVCGPAGSGERPLLMIDPTYTNYSSLAERIGRKTISVTRHLEENGKFTLPNLEVIEKVIQKENPGALLVIPYDNPTGQFFSQETLNDLAKLCVKYNLWFISDEAYREIFYTHEKASSIWGVNVPGIAGRRISIESASKIWNACGLRIGALISDHPEFIQQAVAENTANLCPNVIGQYIFGALLHEKKEDLQAWFQKQRTYYEEMARSVTTHLKKEVPDLIVSLPEAALYSVVDLRKIFRPEFDATNFVMYCAKKGNVNNKTLLLAPMAGFYSSEPNPGKTQLRIAYVEPSELMEGVPKLFAQLLSDFQTLN